MFPSNEVQPAGPVKARYEKLVQIREPFLTRARKCAELTIPTLLPPDGDVASRKLETPYQSGGAAGVNNLAAKLLLALFPPNGRFFRLNLSTFDLERMVADAARQIASEQGGDPTEIARQLRTRIEGEAQGKLAAYERAVIEHYEAMTSRATDSEVFKHLIVAGNVLRFVPIRGDDRPRYYKLDQYVVKREPDGTPLDIIIKEGVTPASVVRDIRQACGIPEDEDSQDKVFELYTRIVRDIDEKCWFEYQELNGVEVPGSRGKWPLDKCPYLPLRWSKIDGEDYGRGHIEEYLGDLITAEGLQKAIVDGSVAGAKVLFLVAPNGTTRVKDIAEAENGDVVSGHAGEVTCLQVNKHNDLRVAAETLADIKRSFGQACLNATSIQRSGERVTATEFQRLAHELETSLGGNYSIMAAEFQLPLADLSIFALQRQKKIPKLPKEVKPTILTGVQALGRNNDLERFMSFIQATLQLPIADDEKAMRLKPLEAYVRIAACLDIDIDNLIRSDEEIDQIKSQAMQQQMMAASTPGIVDAMANSAAQQQPPIQE